MFRFNECMARAWGVALVVGVLGLVNLAVAVVGGLVLHAVLVRVGRGPVARDGAA